MTLTFDMIFLLKTTRINVKKTILIAILINVSLFGEDTSGDWYTLSKESMIQKDLQTLLLKTIKEGSTLLWDLENNKDIKYKQKKIMLNNFFRNIRKEQRKINFTHTQK